MIISIAIWLFIGFATNAIIDQIGFPKWISDTEKSKKILSVVFSIFWPLYYIILIVWVMEDLYTWVKNNIIVEKGHRLYIGNRIAIYCVLLTLAIVVAIIAFRNGGIK